ncbi:TRC8 ring finger protein [Lycorma delicatula]|uniref:TRC8 ring finger protein n=1 Tax=Lycorma delicatula TaxID=130591 RepID=UPI003F50FCC0
MAETMSRRKVLRLVDVILRVPPLFIIDELLRTRFGLPQVETNSTLSVLEEIVLNNQEDFFRRKFIFTDTDYQFDSHFYRIFFIKVSKFVVSFLGCLAASCIFMLWTKHLIILYMYIISVGIVFLSYWANVSTMKAVLASASVTQSSVLEDILSLNVEQLSDPNGCVYVLLQNYVIQCILAYIFAYTHQGPRYTLFQKLLPISFLAPSILALLPLPTTILHHAPVFAALLPLAMVKFILWCSAFPIVQTLYGGFVHARIVISNFGLSTLLETQWQRLNVPCVLRTFWLLRVAEHAGVLMYEMWMGSDETIPSSDPIVPILLTATKSLLISGCDTLTAVLGMTSIISYICHYIDCFFHWVLLTGEEDDKSIGTVSAILFYILALQTGLTALEPEKRFVRLCRNFCLLFVALLHFVHNIVNPLLMSLSASHNPAVHRHIRALGVCLFLIVYPASLLTYLWTHHSISTWLLAVSAFSVEVIVKVIVSLLIYSLFLIDAYRSTFWEKLDDYVYYIRAFGNTVEFCFGIFLFFNGAWILLFESGGAIRAGMMGIHAYFNIWNEALAGWNVFMKRRTAVNKIDSLPEASDAQLQVLDDVCAICYQEMRTAKITRCNHFFHGVCLRKWLYVQDRCPLCHEILYRVENGNEIKEGEEENSENVPQGLQERAMPRDLPGR